VKLKPTFRDADHVSLVAERCAASGSWTTCGSARLGREARRLRQLAAAVGIVVGAAFAAVAIIIIGTTIRMAVLQRGREIAIMRLWRDRRVHPAPIPAARHHQRGSWAARWRSPCPSPRTRSSTAT